MEQITLATKADVIQAKQEIIESFLEALNRSGNQDQHTKQTYLRTRDVINMLGVSPNKLSDMRFKGQIPFKRIGKTYFYPADKIHGLLNNK